MSLYVGYAWFLPLYSCLHTLRERYRTATILAPLLLTSGPAKYEVGLHSNFVVFFVYVYAKGCMQRMVWIQTDKYESMLAQRDSLVCGGGVCRGELG